MATSFILAAIFGDNSIKFGSLLSYLLIQASGLAGWSWKSLLDKASELVYEWILYLEVGSCDCLKEKLISCLFTTAPSK